MEVLVDQACSMKMVHFWWTAAVVGLSAALGLVCFDGTYSKLIAAIFFSIGSFWWAWSMLVMQEFIEERKNDGGR